MADNYVGLTDMGRVRTNNEDAFIAQKLGGYIAACVIDGVGGYEGGEVAAGIARQAIIDYLSVPSGDVTTMMREAFVTTNEKIDAAKKQNEAYESMACVATLAMIDVAAKTVYYVHIGDTRLYLFRDNSLVKITKDQSFVGYLEDSGRLTEAEAMQHPKRNEINNALGFTAVLHPSDIETGSSPFLPGDMLLLCSDGLSDLLSSNDMLQILQQDDSLQAKAKALVQQANDRGGKDNITVVLARNHRKPVIQKAMKPIAATGLTKESITTGTQPAPPVKRKKRTRLRMAFAGFSLLLLLAAAIWVFEKVGSRKNKAVLSTAEKTEQEITFQQALDTTTHFFAAPDSMTALPLVLNDTVWIRNDSLRINGNGMRFLKSATYNGPAFALADSCRFVLLENMLLQNFDVGILAFNKALHLKNVRFVGCRVPLLAQIRFPENVPVSGAVSNFFTPDSLHN